MSWLGDWLAGNGGRKFVAFMAVLSTATALLAFPWMVKVASEIDAGSLLTGEQWVDLAKWSLALFVGANVAQKIGGGSSETHNG